MVSSTGDALLVSPAPMMWDSTAAAGTEPSATSSGDSLIEVPVEAESIQRHTTVLTLTPEAEELTGADVTYPVFIDPSIGPSRLNYLVVRSNASSYYNNSAETLRVGYCGWSGCTPYYSARAYFSFNIATLKTWEGANPVIAKATLNLNQVHNGSAASSNVQVHQASAFNSSTAWPGPLGSLLETGGRAGVGGLQFTSANLANYVSTSAKSGVINFGLRAPNESDKYGWKRFDNNPSLTVQYIFPAGTPTGLTLGNALACTGRTYARTKQPTFSATGREFNSNGPVPIDVQFQILRATSDTQVGALGTIRTQRGVNVSWTTGYTLADGDYRIRARTVTALTDGTSSTSPWTTPVPFTVDTTVPAIPDMKSFTHPIGRESVTADPVTVVGDHTGGTFTLSVPSDSRIAGYAYAFNSTTVPSTTGHTCLSAGQVTDATRGIIKASNGTATLTLPPGVTGTSTLTVKAIDEAGNSSAVTVPYTFTRSATETHYQEMETRGLTLPGDTAWTINSQPMLSGGSQLSAPNPTIGNRYSARFTVPTTGTWALQPQMVKANSYGKVQFEVDGQPVGITDDFTGVVDPIEVNLYVSSGVYNSPEHLPVPLDLTAGEHTLTLISTGQGVAGGGASFTLDPLRLIRQP